MTTHQLRYALVINLNHYIDTSNQMTDCSRTFDYWMEKPIHIQKLLLKCTALDIFEIGLMLNKRGITNLLHVFIQDLMHLHSNIWEWSNLIDSLKYMYNKQIRICVK